MRKIFTIVISGFFILGIVHMVRIAWAQSQDNQTRTEAVNVGNKICTVSGEKIDEKLKATYEYQGKVYNFCCPMCIEEFKKDPQKYIKKVEEELQTESAVEAGTPDSETAASPSMHEGHQH